MSSIFSGSKELELALRLAMQGNCLKRNYGCVIRTKDRVIGFGRTHASEPCEKCKRRFALKGHNYDKCPAIHAEQQALLNNRVPKGAVAFLACFDPKKMVEIKNPKPCPTCMKLLKEAGVTHVVTESEVFEL